MARGATQCPPLQRTSNMENTQAIILAQATVLDKQAAAPPLLDQRAPKVPVELATPRATGPRNRIQHTVRVPPALQRRGRAFTTARRTRPRARRRACRPADTRPTRPSVYQMAEGRTVPRRSAREALRTLAGR